MGAARPWLAGLAVVGGALGLAATLGPGYVGYDAAWALVWGRRIAGGHLPDYRAPLAPTPHPLANLVAVPLSLFRDGGVAALLVLTFLSFAALLACVVVVGARLASWPAGVIAALLIGTFGVLEREAAFASLDLPYLALIAGAALLEARRPRRGVLTSVLLALAGLLRPEAWLLSALYVAWLARGRRPLVAPALIALSAPLLWAASDLVVTGSPLYSLTGTQSLAADLGRPTGLRTAITQTPSSLADLMGTLPLIAAAVALAAGLLVQRRRFAGPLVVLVAGLATFELLGAAELPVLLRYLLLPACVLGLTAGLGLTLPLHARRQTGWAAVSAVVALLLAAAVPSIVHGIDTARAFTRAREQVHTDLLAVARTPAFRRAAARCPVIRVPDFRARPLLRLAAPGTADRISVGNLADGRRGLLLTYASDEAAAVFTLGAPDAIRRQAAPAGARELARTPSWVAYAVC